MNKTVPLTVALNIVWRSWYYSMRTSTSPHPTVHLVISTLHSPAIRQQANPTLVKQPIHGRLYYVYLNLNSVCNKAVIKLFLQLNGSSHVNRHISQRVTAIPIFSFPPRCFKVAASITYLLHISRIYRPSCL